MESYLREILRHIPPSYEKINDDFARLKEIQNELFEKARKGCTMEDSISLQKIIFDNAKKLDCMEQEMRDKGKVVYRIVHDILALKHGKFVCTDPTNFSGDHYETFMKFPRDVVVESEFCMKCKKNKRGCVFVREGCNQSINFSCKCYVYNNFHEWCSDCLYEYVSSQTKNKKIYSFNPDDMTCEIKCHKCEGSFCPYMFIPCKTEETVTTRMPSSLREPPEEVCHSVDPDLRQDISDIKSMVLTMMRDQYPKSGSSKTGKNGDRIIKCGYCHKPAPKGSSHYWRTCPQKKIDDAGKAGSTEENDQDTLRKRQKTELGHEESSDQGLDEIIIENGEDFLGSEPNDSDWESII
jgi:hypothetical protein